MTGNLIGEQFDTYVFDQIRARQELSGAGFGSALKSSDQIQVQNNKNAFIKLASGVNFFQQTVVPTEKEFAATAGSGVLDEDDQVCSSDNQEYTGLSESGKEKYKLISEQIKENNKLQLKAANLKLRNLGLSNTQIKQLGSEETLAKKAILFGGLGELSGGKITQRTGISFTDSIWNLTEAYGLGGNQFGKQPMPGITSAKINCITRGSVRSATIELKAYNTFQFQLIELLYLRLGFTMMLEWGNNKFINNAGSLEQLQSTLIEDMFFDNQGRSQLDVLKQIEVYRNKYSGNYDGFFGRVTNFSWDFSPDGTYNITLVLLTLGDIIESLQINLPSPINSFGANADGETNAENTIEQWLNDFVKNDTKNVAVWSNGKYMNLKSGNYVEHQTFNQYYNEQYNSLSRDAKRNLNRGTQKQKFKAKQKENYEAAIKDNSIITGKLSVTEGMTKENSYFVTFGELLSQIYDCILPRVENQNAVPILAMGLDEKLNVISAQPNQVSFDLNTCFVKPVFYAPGVQPPNSVQKSWMKDFFVQEKIGTDDLFYGQLLNVYLNFEFIKKTLTRNTDKEGALSLFKFLEGICDGINRSLGSVQKIEPIINNELNEIVFIDQNPIKGNPALIKKLKEKVPDPTDVVPFEIYGFNSSNNQSNFVKNFKFNTKIDSNLASMITIGTTAGGSQSKVTDGTAFSKWNAGLQDRFQKKIVLPRKFQTPDEIELQNEQNEQNAIREELSAWWGTTNEEALKKDFNATAFASWEKGDQSGAEGKPLRKIKGYDEDGNRNNSGDFLIWSSKVKSNKRKKRTVKTGRQPRFYQRYAPANKTGSYKGYEFTDVDRETFISGYITWKASEGKNVITEEDVDLGSSYQSWLVYAFGGEIIGKQDTNCEAFTKDSTEGLYYNRSNTQFFKQGKKAFKEYLRLRDQKIFRITGNPSNQQGFIPVELSLTLDGLSGVKIYQKINIRQEFLPPEYISSALTNTIDFIIKSVNHSISDEKWETELVTISIPPTQIENIETIDEGLFTYLGLGTSETVEISGDRTITGDAKRFLASTLRPDAFIMQEIKNSEGYYSGQENKVVRSNGIAYAYPDPATKGEPYTIGYGQTYYALSQQYTRNGQTYTGDGTKANSPVKLGDTITSTQADFGFKAVLNGISKSMTNPSRIKSPLTQNEYNALLSFSYNSGPGVTSAKQPLYDQINKKDYVAAGATLQNTLTLNGLLTSRRMKEADIWFTNNPGNPTS